MQCLPEEIQTCSAVSVPSLGGPYGRRQGVSPSGIRKRDGAGAQTVVSLLPAGPHLAPTPR